MKEKRTIIPTLIAPWRMRERECRTSMQDKESKNGSVQNSTGSCSGYYGFVDSCCFGKKSTASILLNRLLSQLVIVVAEVWEVKKWDGQKQEDVRSGEALDVLQLKRSSDGVAA